MTIYSWNMFFRNDTPDRAFEFIARSDFDIFCLQEVPKSFLARLRTLPGHVHADIEMTRKYRGRRSTAYVVILSRYPIENVGSFPLPYRDPHLPRRGVLAVDIMVGAGIFARGLGNRHGIYADVRTDRGLVRVLCIHLSLTNPRWRAEELHISLRQLDGLLPSIVCGDFNVFESPHITALNYIFGGSVGDMFHPQRERLRLEKQLEMRELTNPLRGRNTHFHSRSQLDHILVSRSFSVKHAEVIRDRMGSDHHPVRVEVA